MFFLDLRSLFRYKIRVDLIMFCSEQKTLFTEVVAKRPVAGCYFKFVSIQKSGVLLVFPAGEILTIRADGVFRWLKFKPEAGIGPNSHLGMGVSLSTQEKGDRHEQQCLQNH